MINFIIIEHPDLHCHLCCILQLFRICMSLLRDNNSVNVNSIATTRIISLSEPDTPPTSHPTIRLIKLMQKPPSRCIQDDTNSWSLRLSRTLKVLPRNSNLSRYVFITDLPIDHTRTSLDQIIISFQFLRFFSSCIFFFFIQQKKLSTFRFFSVVENHKLKLTT